VVKVGTSKHTGGGGFQGLHNKLMAAVHLGHRLWAKKKKKKKTQHPR